jgi:hypothetical protein
MGVGCVSGIGNAVAGTVFMVTGVADTRASINVSGNNGAGFGSIKGVRLTEVNIFFTGFFSLTDPMISILAVFGISVRSITDAGTLSFVQRITVITFIALVFVV